MPERFQVDPLREPVVRRLAVGADELPRLVPQRAARSFGTGVEVDSAPSPQQLVGDPAERGAQAEVEIEGRRLTECDLALDPLELGDAQGLARAPRS